MFQATRRRLALWYAGVTAVLLLVFASGVYLYVRTTLVERVDDTLSHVVEVVQRSLVIEPVLTAVPGKASPPFRINVEASFRTNAETVDDDHIDLEWFSPTGELLWSTLNQPLDIPLHLNPNGETVHLGNTHLLRQMTQRIERGRQVLGYLRVSHPWFEVTAPSRRLLVDLALGILLMVGAVASIGWLLSGLAMAPVRDSYQRLKQFTADASHELRNPIAVIQTRVQVALSDPEPDPQFQQAQLQVIERITRRLGRLVDDLLFLARQDSGIVQLEANPVSLYGLLVDVVHEQQAIAQENSIELKLDQRLPESDGDSKRKSTTAQSSPLCIVQGDRDQLTRLFTNLISNAIQYTPVGGAVRVLLDQSTLGDARHSDPEMVSVRVCDSGLGIPPEDLPHIFDRFYQVDRARVARRSTGATVSALPFTGSGLGLAIAKAIVENHQGQIQVESQPQQGTTFNVTLPIASLRHPPTSP